VIERAFILSEDEITERDLPEKIAAVAGTARANSDRSGAMSLDEIERRHIAEVMLRSENDKVLAAKTLGIDLSTLYRKLKRYEES
jgi:transcriptional regulator with PAS, ATPase and Fis domain